MNRHPQAARTGSIEGRGNRRAISLALVSLVALLALVFASSASALTQRPFKETFGSAAQPTIEADVVAVDRQNGDVLVGTRDRPAFRVYAGKLTRFHADGTPAPFSALGTNVIDGKEANGKPCAEEPASCDKTPNDGLGLNFYINSQIAIDESGGPTDGNIYVTGDGQEPSGFHYGWVDIFAPDGTYLGEITGPNAEEKFRFVTPEGLAVDQTGALYVGVHEYIEKFVPTGNPIVNTDGVAIFNFPAVEGDTIGPIALGAGPTAGSLFGTGAEQTGQGVKERRLAWEFDSETLELKRRFAANQVDSGSVAVDPNTGRLLVRGPGSEIAEFEVTGGSEPVKVGRILGVPGAFDVSGASEVIADGPPGLDVYGTPATVPTVTVEPASEITGTKAVLSGTVNPSGLPLTGCFFEYFEVNQGAATAKTVPCEGSLPPTDSSPHAVRAEIEGLKSNGHTYSFRLVATNGNGREESELKTLTTLNTVVSEAATSISTTGATLNGLLRPEGEKYSACFFEYGINTNAGFEHKVPCIPGAAELPQNFAPQLVRLPVTGLQAATTYRFKLVATSSELGTIEGEELTFDTHGTPRITDVRALNADQSSATLEGKVNPSGFGTSYRIEWGPTASYGHRVPAEFEPFVGTGEMPVRVSGQISGLAAATKYHYRIVATSALGTVASSDHVLETVNSCGLPEGRCFELVSRAEAGPVAIPGEVALYAELHFQVDPSGGNVTYPVESGYPDARRGAEVLYRATRGPSGGWLSTELSPPFVAPSERNETGSEVGAVQWLSDDLSCGFLMSSQPQTNDASARQVIEAGGQNYYRRNTDGSYTAVTKQAPENLEAADGAEYTFVGASQDCKKVLFSTQYRYPGVPVPNPGAGRYTYEWEEGTLRSGAAAGVNSVSEDGSRVFFVGSSGLFVREDGSVDRELVSGSGIDYQWATRDGSKVFFTANAGLTAEASGEGEPEGTDLYEYDLETEELTDRTVAHLKGGAQVAGFLSASEDGSVVYFGSRAQLLPGRGPTAAQNQKADSYSIYRAAGGEFDFVGTFDGSADEAARVFIRRVGNWTSQTSADGRYLLFQSTLNVTGYNSGGAIEAYLYDADSGSEGTATCMSCRQDGLPSLAPARYQVLPGGEVLGNLTHQAHFLVVRDGEPRVFFSSVDALAPGAVEGQNNVYVWNHDQVFRLTSAQQGAQKDPISGVYALFAGASADGTDVYLGSPENLSWEDQDKRVSIFDARVGGGFPQPPAPPAPCNADVEGACQGAPWGGPTVPGAASTTFTGPGNEKQTQAKKKKQTHKKKSKKPVKKKKQKKKGSAKQARHANGNGRTGK